MFGQLTRHLNVLNIGRKTNMYSRVRDVVERCGVTRQTAARWLRGLVESGALAEVRAGREALFINRCLMDVLRP
jgi:DNA-binding IclR family transcriptional regulator